MIPHWKSSLSYLSRFFSLLFSTIKPDVSQNAGIAGSAEELADSLLHRMSFREKALQMAGRRNFHGFLPFTYRMLPFKTRANTRLGIDSISFCDGPRGVGLGRSTCFPVPMGRGASFDLELEEKIGLAMGQEARALGANTIGSVCVNLPYHPGWGRAQETFGADPFHVGEMGAAFVRGLSRNVLPVVKHFAANSIENTRFRVSADMDERTLREVYLPHFKKCVDAGAGSVMSAYNRLNGRYCDQNTHLLKDILKDDWGFDGLVMSDFYMGTHSTAASVKAGLDLEMPQAFCYSLPALALAVARGKLEIADLDRAVKRILVQKIRFGMVPQGHAFSRIKQKRKKPEDKNHRKLALESARKSLVLLTNQNQALPLDAQKIKKLAVAGPLAHCENMGDQGSSSVSPPYGVTPMQGLKNRLSGVTFLDCSKAKTLNKRQLAQISECDATVVFAGLSQKDEGEYFPFLHGGDRTRLELPSRQERLIKALASPSKKLIVVLFGGSAIATGRWTHLADAVIMAWYPGMEGGNAVADTLLGLSNPSGRLPLSFPFSTYDLPPMQNQAARVFYHYHHDYRYYDHHGIRPAFAYGHGLSFTRFFYSNLRLERSKIGPDQEMAVLADVANTGERPGEDVVQCYVSPQNSNVSPRAKKQLAGFQRVQLKPGQEKTVRITFPVRDLAVYDPFQEKWAVEPLEYRVSLGPSSAKLELSALFVVEKES